MHHQDHPGDSPGGRKMSHPTVFHHRRGSSGASSSTTIPGDDSQPPVGSSSPGLQHQSQALGAQMKKKSGFQITSVTPAQINVSTNNSLADDTESYEDMDESHTEDLSNSDMLDVSVSRATDTGITERSSSEETLNSLHGIETPGLVSPNEPLQPQASHQNISMVNGVVHHHQHSHPSNQGNQHHGKLGPGQMPSSVPSTCPLGGSAPALVVAASGSSQTQRVSTMDNIAVIGFAPVAPEGINSEPHVSANVSTAPALVSVTSGQGLSPSSGVIGLDSAGHGVPGGLRGPASAVVIPSTPPTATTASTQTQAAPGSRFRVVKLDSNSEPFRKGRWMCTEYYEKDIHPAVLSTDAAPFKMEAEVGEGVRGPGMPSTAPVQNSQHSLQQSQTQGFTSGPQATQAPAQSHPRTQDAPLEPGVVGGGGVVHVLQHPIAVPSVTIPLAPTVRGSQASDPGSIPQQFQPGGYSTTHGGPPHQPDFIQPTAPFQTQAQSPLPHIQPQHLPLQTMQRTMTQLTSAPLTTLRADLQPLLTHGMPLTHTFSSTSQGAGPVVGSRTATQLEDAQRLLFQQSILASLPRLGATSMEGESSLGGGGAGGGLAHIGMGAEASALVAAAAGLRTQTTEGEEDSSSGASVVAIDNKIEQAMDLVKSHLMYAVREEVEVLKEQIKELMERNSQLEQENTLLKTLASPEQMAEFQAQVQSDSPTISQPPALGAPPQLQQQPALGLSLAPSSQSSGTSG